MARPFMALTAVVAAFLTRCAHWNRGHTLDNILYATGIDTHWTGRFEILVGGFPGYSWNIGTRQRCRYHRELRSRYHAPLSRHRNDTRSGYIGAADGSLVSKYAPTWLDFVRSYGKGQPTLFGAGELPNSQLSCCPISDAGPSWFG